MDENISPEKIPLTVNPQVTLRDMFKCYFDGKGTLRSVESNERPGKFDQKTYNALAKCVEKVVQAEMVEVYHFVKHLIPENSPGPQSYIYTSQNFNSSSCFSKALLLIQGSGEVRPGLWSRSVCINHSLSHGSMLPFLQFAIENQFEVLIFNPNKTSKGRAPIPKNSSLKSHMKYVWKNFIIHCKSSELYIVAHSRGGVATMNLMDSFWDEFSEKVKGIAFTDTVHGYNGIADIKLEFLRRYAVGWMASEKQLDQPLKFPKNGVVCVSAGHTRHEYTTGSALASILLFLKTVKSKNPYLSLESSSSNSFCTTY